MVDSLQEIAFFATQQNMLLKGKFIGKEFCRHTKLRWQPVGKSELAKVFADEIMIALVKVMPLATNIVVAKSLHPSSAIYLALVKVIQI